MAKKKPKSKPKSKTARKQAALVLPPLTEIVFYANFMGTDGGLFETGPFRLSRFSRLDQIAKIPKPVEDGDTDRQGELRNLVRESRLHLAWTRANQVKLVGLLDSYAEGQFSVDEATLAQLTESERASIGVPV